MLQERIPDLTKYVEPDRVRREVYVDPEIFELEMQRIHERVWIYCGHESQVPKSGDSYPLQIGRQPMLMVRGSDGKISVLYNRCPHRGNMMCGDRHGNTGEFFRCSYHSWTFHHDGRLRKIPMMESGYAGTRYGPDNPDCSMKRAARVESYRGFVFASLAKEGPSLKEFLGESRVAFDDMCDRAPEGEVEIVPNDVRGVAVHTAARILSLAQPGEILVSGTTHELLAGSGLPFEDRGSHELKGLSGVRSVYALGAAAARVSMNSLKALGESTKLSRSSRG